MTPKPTLNYQEIESRICDAIQAIPKQFPIRARNALWTQAVKMSLGLLGREIEYKICAGGLQEHFDREWLFDLCWYITTPEGEIREMLLALESEWNRDYTSIKFDFEKLLVAKSKFKVMIFQASGEQAKDYFARLKKGIRVYQGANAGEIYLLACFDEKHGRFEIKRVEGS